MLYTKSICVLSIFLICSCSSVLDLEPDNNSITDSSDSSLLFPRRKIISDPNNESLAHGSRFIASYGDLFITYYSGRTTTIENIEDTDIKVCLTRYSLDLNEVVDRIVVLSKSEISTNGFIQSSFFSPYDPALIELCDTIRVWMVITPTYDGKDADRTIGYRDVSVKGLSLSPSVQVCLTIMSTESCLRNDLAWIILLSSLIE